MDSVAELVKTAAEDFRAAEWDASLPPAWRFQDARRLARGAEPKWAADDAATQEFAEYLGAMADAHGEQAQAAVRQRWPILDAAHELARRNDPLRWEIQSRLLARQSDQDIAARCDVPADVVGWYESLFFSVRDSIDSRMWVCNQVIRSGITERLGNYKVGRFWMAIGYAAGPRVLDRYLAAFRTAWRPGDPIALNVYLRPDAGIDPRIQADVASQVLPWDDPSAKALVDLRLALLEADAVEDRDRRALLRERVRDHLIRCGRAFLAGKPLPRFGRRTQAAKDRQSAKHPTRGAQPKQKRRKSFVRVTVGSARGSDKSAGTTGSSAPPAPPSWARSASPAKMLAFE